MPLGPPIPHPAQVFTVAFSPDGKTILTGDFYHGARLFRRTPELPDDPERVSTWVEVLTGLTLDSSQGLIQVLDNASWLERHERLERLGGPPEWGNAERLDPILFGTNPLARGRVLMERGRWSEAEAAFDEVVRARPYNASGWIERGRFHFVRGQPGRAAAELTQAVRMHPEHLNLHYTQVLSLLAIGDCAGLRRARFDLLNDFGMSTTYLTANSVAWSCVLGPDTVADREAPVRLAEFALNHAPEDEKPVFLNTLGAALYRAGRFEASIRRLEEGIRKQGGESSPQDWVFLALAHHQLGHRAEALRWLDRFRTYRGSESPNAFWNELEIRLLRREAEALIRWDPIFPTDPFAPSP
jgi:tetratricopeptide (TPR) repeat protein